MDKDWLDDYMIMQMMDEDERRENHSPSSDRGCFPAVLGVLAVLWIFAQLIG